MLLSNNRANQKSAIGLSGGLFTGVIAVLALATDVNKLKFQANITYQTGDAGAPSQTFTPCTDDGEVKTFAAMDDIVKWINGAFLDVTTITFAIDNAAAMATAFVPPLDPIIDALKQKTKFQKLQAGILDNKTNAIAKVAAAVASGWDLGTAHPALQANYAGLVTKKDAVLGIEAYYVARIAHFAAIV